MLTLTFASSSDIMCFFILHLLTLATLGSCTSSPFLLNISTKSYGPDGPWQAITIQLGTPPQALDVYPAGVWQSTILAKQVCSMFLSSLCGTGGLFDPSASNSYDNTSIMFGRNSDVSPDIDAGFIYTGLKSEVMDTLILPRSGTAVDAATVSNLSIALYSSLYMTYPDGSHYPPQLGFLSLGPKVNQVFVPIIANLIPGAVMQQGRINSNSYGMHVGSAALKLPLSLWLGGYDALRLSGPVSTQRVNEEYLMEIDLYDIGIGVESGGSPFPYTSRQGILSDGNASITGTIPVLLDPALPYLSLPNSTCASITRDLPVTYQAGYGLYFWNTTDPRYARITTSPSYLSFTFRLTSSTASTDGNVTIKVPFQLLDLTLDRPLISTPTSYFPCQPFLFGQQYSLGRAFLQAAFIGVNWGNQINGEWYLAQAPGPNIPTVPSGVPFGSTVSSPSSNDWADSWKDYWTPLPTSSARSSAASGSSSSSSSTSAIIPSPSPGSSSGRGALSDGAKAGIGVGVAVAALIAVGATIFLIRKRQTNPVRSATSSQQAALFNQGGIELRHEGFGKNLLTGQGHKSEEDQQPETYEVSSSEPAVLLSDDRLRHELAA